MKFCKDCSSCHKEGMTTPSGFKVISLCANMECRDPVDGSMIPCQIARQEQVFCGIQAKYFSKKEEPVSAPLVEIIKS